MPFELSVEIDDGPLTELRVADAIQIEYLGHAGFVVHYAGKQVLIDPWFYPAFLKSWFPFPDNRFLASSLARRQFDYLYVSHTHEDHFDRRFLECINRQTQILCPAYRSKGMLKKFRAMNFSRIIPLAHKRATELAPGFVATVFLDTSHKEDSGLLLDMGGFRFLDLNDCNTALSELPTGIDILAAQFSGAMWYPNCYDYPADVMRDKVARVRGDLLNSVIQKCRVTEAKAYLPSAGPPCFLDPTLAALNDRDHTIFPGWGGVDTEFREACPDTRVLQIDPGDQLHFGSGQIQVETPTDAGPDSNLENYRERRRAEWDEFHNGPDRPVTH